MLQNSSTSLNESTRTLQNLINFFQEFRSDEQFTSVLEAAKTLTEDLEICPQFKENTLQTQKRMFDYESRDETPNNPEKKYKISFFLPIVDTALNTLSERFELLNSHSQKFYFLTNFNELYNIDDETLKKEL